MQLSRACRAPSLAVFLTFLRATTSFETLPFMRQTRIAEMNRDFETLLRLWRIALLRPPGSAHFETLL